MNADMINEIMEKIESLETLTKSDIINLLSIEKRDELKLLFKTAYRIKSEQVGNKVYFRGIIEFSNICQKDCYYCGIRKSNKNVERFMMKEEEILEGAKWAFEQNYGSIVLQSGERDDKNFIEFITSVIKGIKRVSDNKLGITLSLGEQNNEVYKEWFKAGAHRYLIRVETTNPNLYKELHPEDHDFEKRKQ